MKEVDISNSWYMGDICISSISGFIATDEMSLKEYLKENINDDGLIYTGISSIVKNTLIIKSLNVVEEYQGKGYGKKMLIEIINKYNPDSIVLIADIGRIQRAGFNLITFYEKNEFKKISEHMFYPLMFWPISKADKIIMEISK